MVDNRAAGFYGIGGAFNFKSGDPSGTAAKMSREKYGSEAMYLPPLEGEEDEDQLNNEQYVDRSALLRATLNSLAMSNVASVLNANKHKKSIKDFLEEEKNKKEQERQKRQKKKTKNSKQANKKKKLKKEQSEKTVSTN